MKNLLSFILIITINSSCFSQDNLKDCKKISKLDEDAYLIDTGKLKYKGGIIRFIEEKMFPVIFLKGNFRNNLDCINKVETITWISHLYNEQIHHFEYLIRERKFDAIQSNSWSPFYQSPNIMRKKLEAINERISEIMPREFVLYKHRDAKEKWLTYFYFDHINDFLGPYNNDRDLTGKSRIEIGTDKLKLRLIAKRDDDWYNLNSKSWYTYQTLFMGGEAYTPDLDSDFLISNDSFDPYDRPFASFTYFGWSRHGILRTGRTKYSIEWKIGTIGSLSANDVQSIIHRDITIDTRRPHGWESQIANGGRLGINYNFNFEYLINKDKTTNLIPYISTYGDIKLGTQINSLGIGFNLSNKDLKSKGSLKIPLLKNNTIDFAFNLNTELRYVQHNSMLEGYGFGKITPDEDTTSPTDIYFLNSDQINRFLFISELSVGIDFKYFGLFYGLNIMSPEYKINNIPQEFTPKNDSSWNHVGKLGLLFKI